MAGLFNKSKTIKDKLQLIKDLASGKKTLESMIEAVKPGRYFSIYENSEGTYTCNGKTMNQAEFDEWYNGLDLKENDSVFRVRYQKGNEPLPEDGEGETPNKPFVEKIESKEYILPDGSAWEETKQYSQNNQPGMVKTAEVPPVTVEKKAPTAVPPPKEKKIRKAKPIIIKKKEEKAIIGETFTIKCPPFKRDLDMRQFRGLTDAVNNLFNNR